jgi:hypothetical protein
MEWFLMRAKAGGLSILQYVDNTYFLGHYLEKPKNLKLLLSAFE